MEEMGKQNLALFESAMKACSRPSAWTSGGTPGGAANAGAAEAKGNGGGAMPAGSGDA